MPPECCSCWRIEGGGMRVHRANFLRAYCCLPLVCVCPYGVLFAASIARLIYLKKGLGVGALQRHFGGRHRKGARTEKFRKSSAGVIRTIMQQLEQSGTIIKRCADRSCWMSTATHPLGRRQLPLVLSAHVVCCLRLSAGCVVSVPPAGEALCPSLSPSSMFRTPSHQPMVRRVCDL